MRLYQALRTVDKFRTVFDFGGRDVAHWFPGHMAKGDSFAPNHLQNMLNIWVGANVNNITYLFTGLKQMRASLRNVDCIIEIHDARISFAF